VSHSADEASCRMFLCARCRSQVLVCRRCDRGQIYCVGTCAQEARRDRQREARRRYQATPRGRVMHAARNRRYRARGRCVTDHGLDNEHKASPLLPSDVDGALSKPSSSTKSLPQWSCHHCRRAASAFVHFSALRPRRDRRKNGQISRRGAPRSHPDRYMPHRRLRTGGTTSGPARRWRTLARRAAAVAWLTRRVPGTIAPGKQT
jgi:hypothetical protein